MDLKQLNAIVLRRQYLEDPAPIAHLDTVISDIVGLHATTATTPFLSLFARCQGFQKEHLIEALYTEKRLGRLRCMRKTIFILAKEMIPIAHAATHRMVSAASRRYMEAQGVSIEEYEQLAGQILNLLAEREMTANEIKAALGRSTSLSACVQLMCDEASAVRARPKASWRSGQLRYARFVDYFPDLILGNVDEDDACAQLVERYLRAFGPATENDIVWWLGLGKRKVRSALRWLQDSVEEVNVKGVCGDLIALCSENARSAGEFSRAEPVINLLPCLDQYLMGYIERERYLDNSHYRYVFDRSGNATSTILLDGRVVGVWDCQGAEQNPVKLLFFSRIETDLKRSIHRQALRMGRFIAETEVPVVECDSMIPLTSRSAGSFLSPLAQS